LILNAQQAAQIADHAMQALIDRKPPL